MKKIEIPEQEFNRLYSMYVMLSKYVNYTRRNQKDPMWQFMLDDITDRSEKAIQEYDKLFETWRNTPELKILDPNL